MTCHSRSNDRFDALHTKPEAGWAQSIELKILTLNDVQLGLSFSLKQTILIFTRQTLLNEEKQKMKWDFLSKFYVFLYEVHLKSICYGDQINWKSSSKFLEIIVVAELLSSYNMQLQNFVFSQHKLPKNYWQIVPSIKLWLFYKYKIEKLPQNKVLLDKVWLDTKNRAFPLTLFLANLPNIYKRNPTTFLIL